MCAWDLLKKLAVIFITSTIVWPQVKQQGVSLVAQLVENPPAMRETWVRSLGWEDPLEKGKATHSSILAWRIPWKILVINFSILFTVFYFIGFQF